MTALATTDDVANRWRPLTSAEEDRAGYLLEDASAILRFRVSTVDARITAGTLDADLVRAIVARMVIRAMVSPEAHIQSRTTSIDDYSETERYETTRDALFVSDEDLELLAESGSSAGAFTIRPTYSAPVTVTDGWWDAPL